MEWLQVLVIIFGNAAWTVPMWLWARSESRADHRALEAWTKDMMTAIQQEMKDFHGRLCAIEEKNRGK